MQQQIVLILRKMLLEKQATGAAAPGSDTLGKTLLH
jgi:hypothetical protein